MAHQSKCKLVCLHQIRNLFVVFHYLPAFHSSVGYYLQIKHLTIKDGFYNLSPMPFLIIWTIAGWYLGWCKWTDLESASVFPVKYSPARPNHFKQQTIQKAYTAEISMQCRIIQAFVFCRQRKKITVGKEGSRKCLPLQFKWLFQLCFWEVNASILGQPSSQSVTVVQYW